MRVVPPPQGGRRHLQHADGLHESQPARRRRTFRRRRRRRVQQTPGLHHAGGRDHVSGGDFLAVVEHQRRDPAFAGDEPRHAAFHAPFAAGRPVFVQEHAQHPAHALPGAREALEKDRPEHDAKLDEIHVLLLRAAVIHQGTEQHVLQAARSERCRRTTARADTGGEFVRGAVRGPERADQPPEAVDLPGKCRRHLRLQHRRVVGETQHVLAPGAEGHVRLQLRTEVELLPLDPELAQQLAQRRALDPRRHVIGHGVQADVVLPAVDAVEAVQPAGGVVPLQDADPPAEMRQTDAGGQAGHAGADDGHVIVGGRTHTQDKKGRDCTRPPTGERRWTGLSSSPPGR